MVLGALLLFSVSIHYAVMRLNWRRDQDRVEKLRRSALAAAWGAWFQTPEGDPSAPVSRSRPVEKKVRIPLAGYAEMPAAPSPATIAAGTVDWHEEGQKVRKALAMPARGAAPSDASNARIVDAIVYGDGSIVIIAPDTNECIPLEPMPKSAAPSFLWSTWPAALVRSLFTKREALPEESSAEDVTSEPAVDGVSTPLSKSAAKRRKRAAKKA